MRRRVEHSMGTAVSLALRGRHVDDGRADAAWAAVMSELRWADTVFSLWRSESFMSRLARSEIDLAACPTEVAEVLQIGERAHRESQGAFSIRLPGPQGRRLDPTGVVKGWAIDRAAGALTDLVDTDWALSVGGDLRCRSADAPWRIGVEDPADPQATIAVVPIHSGAVATSGAAWRGAHVVDGRTGLPATGLRQVTVLADTALAADVDATSAYALGAGGPAWLTRRGRTAVVVDENGTARVISGRP